MPRFHHVNLGVAPGGVAEESSFILDVLGYRRVELTDDQRAMGGLNWFEADDGSQIHLSEDPEHHPAERAHVALHYGEELGALRTRLQEREWKFSDTPGFEGKGTILCKDPFGNRFELRG